MSADFSTPHLPAMGWVADLKNEDRDLLSSYGEFSASYPGNDVIIQGAVQTHLYMVISGKLQVLRTGLESDLIVGEIATGECFGEICIFDPGEASATVRAIEFSQVWRIDGESLGHFISDNPAAANILLVNLSIILSRRVRALNHRIVEIDRRNS